MSGRRMAYKERKGPFMPSMKDQTPTGPRKNWMWKPGASSTKEQKRNLRNRCRHIIDSKDPIVISVGDRVIRAVCQEPDPEFSALHLFCAALDLASTTGEPWENVMNDLMDKYDARAEMSVTVVEEADGQQANEPKPASSISRLLRSLVPSGFRRRHEAVAEAGIHQHVGGGPAPSATSIVAGYQSEDDRRRSEEADARSAEDVSAGR